MGKFNKILQFLILSLSLVSISFCKKQKTQTENSSNFSDVNSNLSEKKGEIAIQFNSFLCSPTDGCSVKSQEKYSFTVNHDSLANSLNLFEELPFIPDDLTVAVLKSELMVASIRSDGSLLDVGSNEVLVNSCYQYILDKLSELLFLSSKDDVDLILDSSEYQFFPISVGKICTGKNGVIKEISDESVYSSESSLEYVQIYLRSFLEDDKSSLNLTRFKFSSLFSSSSGKSATKTAKAIPPPELKFRSEIDLRGRKIASMRTTRFTSSEKIAVKNIVKDIDSSIDNPKYLSDNPQVLKELSNDNLVFLMNYSAIRGHKSFDLLEGELITRLKAKGDNILFPTKAFNDQGVPQLIDAYKEIYPSLRSLDIVDVPRGNLLKEIESVGEGQKKAILVHSDKGAHRGLIYIDNESKIIYYSDSIGLNSMENMQNWMAANRAKGYQFFSHNPIRQTDTFNCAIFCLRDVRAVDETGFVRNLDSNPIAKQNTNVASIVPAELLVATQSINKLRLNQEIGELMANAKKSGKTYEEFEKEFNETVFARVKKTADDTKKDADKDKLSFVKGYQQELRRLYDSDELQQLYFYRKGDLGEVETALEGAKRFEANGQNTYITTVRAMLLSRIAQRALKK